MIEFQNVSRSYLLDKDVSITPVRSINLTVNKGEFILLVGRSGSGKTSLLNLAAGLIRPTEGKVFVKGRDIWTLTDRQLSSLRARTIGFVFQFPSLVPSLNVIENTVIPASFTGTANGAVNDRARELLTKLGLSGRMTAFPRQLSSGEQKRAVLARALVNRPEILLADEPTSDLDAGTAREIMVLLGELHGEGTTIIMVTHSIDLPAKADRTLKMEEGNLVDYFAAG